MTKILLYISVFISISFQMASQNDLLIKERGCILIIDIQGNTKMTLSQTYDLKLLGYKIDNDSLKIYSGNDGALIKEKFPYKGLQNICNHIKPVNDNLISLYAPKRDNAIAIYNWENINLRSNLGLEIECYSDSILLWEKRHKVINYGPFVAVGLGYQSPVISRDKKGILFTVYKSNLLGYKRKPKLVEIEVATGKETTVSRKSLLGSYSCNSEYILFRKNMNWHHKYGIYERSSGKIQFFTSWESAFWLK